MKSLIVLITLIQSPQGTAIPREDTIRLVGIAMASQAAVYCLDITVTDQDREGIFYYTLKKVPYIQPSMFQQAMVQAQVLWTGLENRRIQCDAAKAFLEQIRSGVDSKSRSD